MTPEEFKAWVKQMKDWGIAQSRNECGRLLGVVPNTMIRFCKNGCDKRTALACKALLHRLDQA